MEETPSRAGFSSYPNQVLASLNVEPPRILCNTTFHPFENLPSSKENERERDIPSFRFIEYPTKFKKDYHRGAYSSTIYNSHR